ncbi:ComF family protein [Phocicoccus pinnipedialis]|nr:phosphoribosyltransferase family protein [Jeotgalicoccus pinnipedialis]
MFEKDSPICESCSTELLKETDTNYEYPHEVISFLSYNEAVANLFHRYKFMGDNALKEVLASFVSHNFKQYDFVISIPLSSKRLKERGFNQVTEVLDCLKVKYTDVLETSHRKRQSERSKIERTESQNPFTIKSTFDVSKLLDKRILIVDDIYTTGMTMTHAVNVLMMHRVNEIKVLTFSKV